MLNYFQAISLGALQGVSELFPISSLGHSVLLPNLLHWRLDQHDPNFLIFLVATHAATAAVLLAFFWRDWLRLIQGFGRSLRQRQIKTDDPDAKLIWLLIVGTVPAGVLGLLFEERLKQLFAAPLIVAGALMLNGLMLFAAERLRRQQKNDRSPAADHRLAKLSWRQTLKIGGLQCLALIPGLSRTGSTITGGLLVGLSHEDAARFSFLLATPIIAAAAVLKLPELAGSIDGNVLGPLCAGSVAAAIFAYVTVKFLTRYFKTNTLMPFAIYCVFVGIASQILFLS